MLFFCNMRCVTNPTRRPLIFLTAHDYERKSSSIRNLAARVSQAAARHGHCFLGKRLHELLLDINESAMTNASRQITLRILIVAIVSIAAISQQTSAAESVSVITKSGRTFRGAVDAKSSDTHLWLRFGSTRAQLLRPIDWSNVESVTYEGRVLDSAASRKLAAELKSVAPKMPSKIGVRRENQRSDAELAQQALAQSPARAVSLEITAYAANWDRDVEVDGLVITVTPRDEYGQILPTSGTLEVELISEMSRVRETITAGESRIRNERIGRWTQRVAPEHFDALGASYRLPFQAIHPEFTPSLINLSLVNAKLSAPGSGTLNASTTAVRIRPLSTFRDRYENRHGGRFAPIERTGRGKVQ